LQRDPGLYRRRPGKTAGRRVISELGISE